MSPIVPPASPIAVATRPSMPGRWSIRTRRVSENWAEVVLRHRPELTVEGRPAIRRASLRGPSALSRAAARSTSASSSAGLGAAGGPASSQPSGPAIAVPATHSTPRSVPQRSHTAIAMRFVAAATIVPQDLHRALAGGPGPARPVRRHAQQLGVRERRAAHPLGELEVVADHRPDPAVRRVEHRPAAPSPGVNASDSRSHRWTLR